MGKEYVSYITFMIYKSTQTSFVELIQLTIFIFSTGKTDTFPEFFLLHNGNIKRT